MARIELCDGFIIDDKGFVINIDGEILPNYISKGRVYTIVNKEVFFYDDLIEDYELVYKDVKYLKTKKVFRTYVREMGKLVGENTDFSSESLAAEHVNGLYELYGLNRIPNVIPTKREVDEY